MTISEYLEATSKTQESSGVIGALFGITAIRLSVICADGFCMSVQASEGHYCRPRDNFGPYSAVEVGYPSEAVPELMEYAEDADNPTSTVYGYVPVEVVEAVLTAHGGIKVQP